MGKWVNSHSNSNIYFFTLSFLSKKFIIVYLRSIYLPIHVSISLVMKSYE